MDRKIFFALAAVAGICAAILLLPSRDDGDTEATSTQQSASAGQETKPAPRERNIGTAPEGDEEEEREPSYVDLAKADAKAANEARRATPYFQFTQTAANRWQMIANTIGPQGHTELAEDMRELARQIRAAARADGTEDAQQAAIEAQGAMLERLETQSPDLDAEMSEALEVLRQAHQSISNGEAPASASGGE